MPNNIAKHHDKFMKDAVTDQNERLNRTFIVYAKDKEEFIFPISLMSSMFPSKDNKDGFEFVAVL